MHSCSVAVPFQQVQYLVHEVSWPKMPYSQSQCSVEIGASVEYANVWLNVYHTKYSLNPSRDIGSHYYRIYTWILMKITCSCRFQRLEYDDCWVAAMCSLVVHQRFRGPCCHGALMMEAGRTYETLVKYCQATRSYKSENCRIFYEKVKGFLESFRKVGICKRNKSFHNACHWLWYECYRLNIKNEWYLKWLAFLLISLLSTFIKKMIGKYAMILSTCKLYARCNINIKITFYEMIRY